MVPELILHIGHPKTGTTSLQRCLDQSRDILRDHGICYPPVQPFNNHKALIGHFVPQNAMDAQLYHHLGRSEKAVRAQGAKVWDALQRGAAERDTRRVVLSSEQFFRYGANPYLVDFINGLRTVAEKVRVVAYLRAPEAFYPSRLQQDLKLRDKLTPISRNYFRDHLEPFLKIEGVVLHVHKFERSTLSGGNLVADFRARYLTPCPADALVGAADEENTTISAEAALILQHLRTGLLPLPSDAFPVLNGKLVRLIMAQDAQVPGKTGMKLKPGVAAQIHDWQTDLDWVAERFGVHFARPQDARGVALTEEELRHVEKICVIDHDRQDALWEAIMIAAQHRASFAGRWAALVDKLRPRRGAR